MSHLAPGRHRWTRRTCAMEAVALYAGEQKTDTPETASPLLTFLVQGLNDRWPASERQQLWLLVPQLVGTRDHSDQERALAFAHRVAYDWSIEGLPERPVLPPVCSGHTPRAWLSRYRRNQMATILAHRDRVIPIIDQASAEQTAYELRWLSERSQYTEQTQWLFAAARVAATVADNLSPARTGQLFADVSDAVLYRWPDGSKRLITLVSEITQPPVNTAQMPPEQPTNAPTLAPKLAQPVDALR
jgi:hypothetical protein